MFKNAHQLDHQGPSPLNHPPLYVRLCSDHLSLEVIPRHNLRLDLKFLESALARSAGFSTIVASDDFLIIKHDKGAEITIRRDGRMIVRRVSGEDEVRILANELLNLSVKSESDQ